MSPLRETDERIFTFSDIYRLYKKKKIAILRIALFGWVIVFGICLLKAPKYKLEATFKEGIETSSSGEGLKELLSNLSAAPAQPEAVAILKSNQVLKPVIAKLGLQASVPTGGMLAKLYRRVRDNLKAERQKALEDPDEFCFRDVIYEGELPHSYFLRFDDATHFSVLGSDKKILAHGILGAEVCLPDAQFVLERVPQNLRFRRLYTLRINSWVPIASSLRKELKITNQKNNKSIYDLVFFHRNRFLGSQVLNELMAEYQRYLKRNHDQISKEQLAYLDKRQEDVCRKMGEILDQHAEYFAHNLERGLPNLEEGEGGGLLPYREMMENVFKIEIELAKLKQFEQGDRWLAFIGEGPFAEKIMGNAHRIRELKKQRDLFELSLQGREEEGNQLAVRQQELQEVRSRCEASKKLLDIAQSGEVQVEFPFDLDFTLSSWVENLKRSTGEARRDFASYLENHIRLLTLREKMLQERLFYGSGSHLEFEGIDLPTANNLFVEYNRRLDGHEAAMRHSAQLREEIETPDFEISSLSSVLQDPLSQNLISQAGNLAIRLKDKEHHSEKERRMWLEELQVQKRVLKDHLEQLFKVEELNATLAKEKIVGLQKVSLNCINQEISVLYAAARDALQEQYQGLLTEKELLKKKIEEMCASMADLPGKWRLEKWLTLRTKIATKIMETMTQLVEAKTVSHHLHHIESKPLDLAILPLRPSSPHLFRMGFLGAFGASFGFFFFCLIQTIMRGFPSSLEKLRAMRFPLLGEISSFCDGPHLDLLASNDLEILRQVNLFLERDARRNPGPSGPGQASYLSGCGKVLAAPYRSGETPSLEEGVLQKPPQAKVVSLLMGRGPDYSYALGENLARMSLRSLIIRCDFQAKYKKEDLPGLLQAWKGEVKKLPIRSQNGFDVLMAGGFTPYSTEILQSKAFEEIVAPLKEKYDYLFLLLRSPLLQSDSKAALRVSDKVIVTVSEEPTEELTPFVDWAYHEGDCRLTFVVSKTS